VSFVTDYLKVDDPIQHEILYAVSTSEHKVHGPGHLSVMSLVYGSHVSKGWTSDAIYTAMDALIETGHLVVVGRPRRQRFATSPEILRLGTPLDMLLRQVDQTP
jgi:hypothetical protein